MYTFDAEKRCIMKDTTPIAYLYDGVQNEEGLLLVGAANGFPKDEALLDRIGGLITQRNITGT